MPAEIIAHIDAVAVQEFKQAVVLAAAERGLDSAIVMQALAELAGGVAAQLDQLEFARTDFAGRMQAFVDHAHAAYERARRFLSTPPDRRLRRGSVS